MASYTEKEINRLQDNLQTIRQIGGWTAAEFGEMIGVTKQTISNLENRRTAMTKTMYIAIRAVLDAEIETHPEKTALAQVVDLLLNHEDISAEAKEKTISAAAFASGARKTGLDAAAIAVGMASLLGSLITSPAVIAATGKWLVKLLSEDKGGN